ncbi:MAG TPA: ABC transporter permease [Polyangiaceae bacterium]|nr:ABC transporter permease [Polyangiaceae bacterium]
MLAFFGRVGQAVLARFDELVQIGALFYAAIKGAVIEGRRGRGMVKSATATQIYFTAVEPLAIFLLVAVTCGFFAIVLSDSLMRPNGLAPHIPKVIAEAVVRELVPLVIALVVIGRSGPAIATELGYMRVNDEIEALDLAGANTDYLVVLPRIAGVTIATAALTVAMSVAALLGGFLLGNAFDLISVGLRFDQILESVSLLTIALAMAKAVMFGVVIATVNCYHGLAVKRSFTEIPRANVRGAVQCYLGCFLLNAALSLYALMETT